MQISVTTVVGVLSLSARRAWIEIDIEGKLDANLWVALRKESVDRNTLSLSFPAAAGVALRKESVDRNQWIKAKYPGCRCRSPQGERG